MFSAALILALLMFVAMAISSITAFNREHASTGNHLIRYSSLIATAVLAGLSWDQNVPPWQGRVAVGILIIAIAVLCWSVMIVRNHDFHVAFTGDCGPDLVTSGPYRYLSNPLYVSYTLYWGSWILLTNGAWIAWTAAALFCHVYLRAMRMERSVLRRTFGQEYETYLRRVWI